MPEWLYVTLQIVLAALALAGAWLTLHSGYRLLRWSVKLAIRRLTAFYPAPPDTRYHPFPKITPEGNEDGESLLPFVRNGDPESQHHPDDLPDRRPVNCGPGGGL